MTSSGLTTELPSYAFAVAIRGKTPTSVRGAFVFEQALTNDSPFSQEIRGLAGERQVHARPGGSWTATAPWSPPPSAPGWASRCPTRACARCPRVCTRSATSSSSAPTSPSSGGASCSPRTGRSSSSPLAGPLQSAGLILVLLLLAIGLTLTVLLARRLRQSREQEARLLALNRSQDEFISVVSHELRTPVSGVLGFLQTSLDHWEVMSDEDRHSAVRRAFSNARRLQAMTRDVLDTESIESGRFGYVRHPMDLGDEVRTAVDAFSTRFGQRRGR